MPSSPPEEAVPQLAVAVAEGGDLGFAEALACRLGVPFVDALPADKSARGRRHGAGEGRGAREKGGEDAAAGGGLFLRVGADGLALVGSGMELRGDFSRMARRCSPANLNRELLIRAAKVKGCEGAPVAVDATAGLGEDAFLLAAAGFSVMLFERDAVIAELLQDTLRRAQEDDEIAGIASRMRFAGGDSIEGFRTLAVRPDVVYLDPMFPARRKSAAVKKKFQLLHRLESPCEEQEALLSAALATHPRKVVVKRPAKGELLAGVKPSYSIAGKAVRYDCIVPPRA